MGKVKERYALGWSDPRGTYGTHRSVLFESIPIPHADTKFADVDTEVLRNLWTITFGNAPVSHDAVREHYETDDDIFWVGHVLYLRGQLQLIEMHIPVKAEVFTGYALTKEA